jgi:hypothetical protein
MSVLAAASGASAFTTSNALTTLLTVESLLFAGLAAATSLSSSSGLAVSPQSAARVLALGVALVLTAVAVGAGCAWARLFAHAWPSRLDEQIPLVCLLLGITAQPVVAWTAVRLIYRR